MYTHYGRGNVLDICRSNYDDEIHVTSPDDHELLECNMTNQLENEIHIYQ